MPRKFLFGKYTVILLTEAEQIKIKKTDGTYDYVYEIQIQHSDNGMVANEIELEPAPRHILAKILENNGRIINVTPDNFIYPSYSKHITALRNALGRDFFPKRMANRTLEIFGYTEISEESVNDPKSTQKKTKDVAVPGFRLQQPVVSVAQSEPIAHISVLNTNVSPPKEIQKVSLYMKDNAPSYRITVSLLHPDVDFLGRTNEMHQIHEQLSSANNKLLLFGMGGIGKSEIAKKYAVDYFSEYETILWVPFSTSIEQTISSDKVMPIQGVSRENYPEDSERDYFERKIRIVKEITDRRTLLIIDNIDISEDPDLEDFCSGRYSVLFTSRCDIECSLLPRIEISQIEDEEILLEIFRCAYKGKIDEISLPLIQEMLKVIDGHTLTIRLVASVMRSCRISPTEMLDILKHSNSSESNGYTKASDKIFDRLRQLFRVSALSEAEQNILKNLSILGLQGISVKTFYEWCKIDDYDVINGLISKSWVIHDQDKDEVHLHPLVAELSRELLERDGSCCNPLLQSLRNVCHLETNCTWDEKIKLLYYATAVYERLPHNHSLRHLALDAKASIVMGMALYQESSILFSELLGIAVTLEQKIYAYHKLSHSLLLSGDASQALNVAKSGISLVNNIPLQQLSIDVGYRYNELCRRVSEAYIKLHQIEQAIDWARKALDFCDSFVVDSHQRNRGWVEYHLANALYHSDRNDMNEAKDIITHAIKLFEEVDDVWSSSYAYDLLSQIIMKSGDCMEALELNNKARSILLRYYGTEHADMARNLKNRGTIYLCIGNKESAEACFRQASEIYTHLNCLLHAEKMLSFIQ